MITATGITTARSLTLNTCGSVTFPKYPHFRIPSFSLGYRAANIPAPVIMARYQKGHSPTGVTLKNV